MTPNRWSDVDRETSRWAALPSGPLVIDARAREHASDAEASVAHVVDELPGCLRIDEATAGQFVWGIPRRDGPGRARPGLAKREGAVGALPDWSLNEIGKATVVDLQPVAA
jgi:hypothetical protein